MNIGGYQEWAEEIDSLAIRRHLEELCRYEKLSGEPDALRAVRYIQGEMQASGIDCRVLTFPAYLSNPVESRLKVDGVLYGSRPRSFSGSCDRLEAELVFDRTTEGPEATELEKERFWQTVRGKIVVGYGFDERYGKLLEAHGAAGWIQVWRSGEALIHEDTAGAVWGTPDLDSRFLLLHMPVVGVTLDTGRRLVERLQSPAGPVMAELTVQVDCGVREVALPVAEIRGESEEFLLLSCHYDTWYQGAFDNCAANGAVLEIARVLKKHEKELKRSVRVAWWPGHSNGRYMGSTWYCDHFFGQLRKNCVACLNSDLIGVSGVDMMGVKTTGAEGEAFLKQVLAVAAPGLDLVVQAVGRGADQSFFGADIPYHISPRMEARKRPFATPGPGNDFWHTAEDTFDKLDFGNLKTDGQFLGLLTFAFAREQRLPLDTDGYFGRWMGRLEELMGRVEPEADEAGPGGRPEDRKEPEADGAGPGSRPGGQAGPDADGPARGLAQVMEALNGTRHAFSGALARCATDRESGALVKHVIGTLNRLFQSSGSPYGQDTAFAYGPFHLLGESAGVRRQESPEELWLFAHTTFVRQRNRMVTELEGLEAFCKAWAGKQEVSPGQQPAK